jgi:transposase
MLSLNPFCRYFLYQEPCDMRCGIYSLAGLVQNRLKQNPLSGDIFIFIGKSGNQIRLLQWDKDGYALYIKRLEKGTFERPVRGEKPELSAQELMLVLGGIKLKSVEFRKRYRHGGSIGKTA